MPNLSHLLAPPPHTLPTFVHQGKPFFPYVYRFRTIVHKNFIECGICGKKYKNILDAMECLLKCSVIALKKLQVEPIVSENSIHFCCPYCARIYMYEEDAKNCLEKCREAIITILPSKKLIHMLKKKEKDSEKKILQTQRNIIPKPKITCIEEATPIDSDTHEVQVIISHTGIPIENNQEVVKAENHDDIDINLDIPHDISIHDFDEPITSDSHKKTLDFININGDFEEQLKNNTKITNSSTNTKEKISKVNKEIKQKEEKTYFNNQKKSTNNTNIPKTKLQTNEDNDIKNNKETIQLQNLTNKNHEEKDTIKSAPPKVPSPPKIPEILLKTKEKPLQNIYKENDEEVPYEKGSEERTENTNILEEMEKESLEKNIKKNKEGLFRKPNQKPFIREGARYICTVCKSKYFTQDEVNECFFSHPLKS